MEANDLSSLVSAVAGNPELMQRVMGALSSLPREEAEEKGSHEARSDEVAPVLGERGFPRGNSERKQLLIALKPYLSQSRRDKAEMLINIMAVLDSGILNMLGKGD